MTFQTNKVDFVRLILAAPAKVSKGSLHAKGGILGGALNRFYTRLERCNQGNRALSNLYGGGLLAPNYADVAKALLFRPAIGWPEIKEVALEQDGLRSIHQSSYLMGFDYVRYYDVNGGPISSGTRRNLRDLNNEVRSRPRASILDLAADGAPTGAITHVYLILNMLLDDFSNVTINAPIKPADSVLAPLWS